MNHLLAQIDLSKPEVNPTARFTSLEFISKTYFPFIMAIAAIVLLFMMLYAGFIYLQSAGDAKKVEKAQHTITYGLVGFFLALSAYLIVNVLQFILGVKTPTP